jgi:hypothetical protein
MARSRGLGDVYKRQNFERVWTVEFPYPDTCHVIEWGVNGDTIFTFTLVRL